MNGSPRLRLTANGSNQAQLAGQIFYTLAIASAKLSFASFLLDLSPVTWHLQVTWAISILIILWSLSSLLVVAFRCKPLNTWDLRRDDCINDVGQRPWLHLRPAIIQSNSVCVRNSWEAFVHRRRAFYCYGLRTIQAPSLSTRFLPDLLASPATWL